MRSQLLFPILIFIAVTCLVSGCTDEPEQKNQGVNTLMQMLMDLRNENVQLRKNMAKKAEKFGSLTEQITLLSTENARLKTNVAKTNIHSVGNKFLLILVFLIVLIINNAVWFIIYRRKQ
ncbi:hypothetical protein [Desulfonema magnum]|uniref:Uncharacterized protein n=1 Tax=Desulfonema magnum TaxID=45655 RepID=A0A975BX55_9BACT|nr:hypothetical protein [Desulfonema magnum]QTA93338.1 Uncharacterized protein dnm_094390 [Desulfonema magnum]